MGQGPNLVLNSGFDVNFNNWTAILNGNQPGVCERYVPGPDMIITASWVFIPPMTHSPGYSIGHQAVTVVADTDYIMTFDVKQVPAAPIALGGVSEVNQTPLTSWVANASLDALGVKTIPFTVPPSVTTLYAKFTQQSLGSLAPTMRVDDITIREQGVSNFIPMIRFF